MCAPSYTIPGTAPNSANMFTVHGLRCGNLETATPTPGTEPGTHPTAGNADFPMDGDGAGRDHA